MTTPETILVLNSGSSSVKYGLFDADTLECQKSGKKEIPGGQATPETYGEVLSALVDELDDNICAAGHRVVHGGRNYTQPALVDDGVIKDLKDLIPLAPLHQPFNMVGVEMLRKIHPSLPQVVCFDTAFHRTQSELSQMYAIPKKYTEEGVMRYGFHGLSYEYIASALPEYTDKAKGRVVVAHLGNGASMCAIKDGKSVFSTMGFTAVEGLMMGTRTGWVDPGVLLFLMREKNMSVDEIEKLIYRESGLWGVSGVSSDMRELLSSTEENAGVAVDLFCRYATRAVAKLSSELEGLDVLVFTAGTGENSHEIRERICERLGWMGVIIDKESNEAGQVKCHASTSKVEVLTVPTNEERAIAQHVLRCIGREKPRKVG